MAPVCEEDRIRVKALLTEAVTVLCKDGLHHNSQLSIEGLLGITVDCQDIILVNINETVYADLPEVKKEGRRRSSKGTKRAMKDTPSPSRAKKATPSKAKRKRKDPKVPPIIIQPSLGQLHIVEADQSYLDQSYGQDDINGTPNTVKAKKRSIRRSLEENPMDPETINGIQRTILEQEGCVVLSRILQRRKNKFCASDLIHCMRDMSRGQSDRNYVGEYKEIGNIKIFYKCPPELLHGDALTHYSISLQEYTNLYYNTLKPSSGCPTDWPSYVATVLANTPYNPMLFPIDAMGLGPEEKQILVSKQMERQRAFQQAASASDSEDGGVNDNMEQIKAEPEDQELDQEYEEDELEEPTDPPGVGLGLTIPVVGSVGDFVHDGYGHETIEETVVHDSYGHETIEETVVHDSYGHETIEETVVHDGYGHETIEETVVHDSYGHETIEETVVHDGYGHQTIEETVDCGEMIETETVVEDSLVMDIEPDYNDSSS